MESCPEADELKLFSAGRLGEVRWNAIAAHLESCERCIEAMSSFEDSSGELIRKLRDEATQSLSDRIGNATVEDALSTRSLETSLAHEASVVKLGIISRAEWNAMQRDHPNVPLTEHLESLLKLGRITPFQFDRLISSRPEVLRLGNNLLIDELGRGGMGVVYRARDLKLGRLVAIKTMHSNRYASRDATERFRLEARVAARLEHQNIVPIFEIGESEDVIFFAMAYIDGNTLAAKLKGGPLEGREAAELLAKIADAVQYAHDKGVIHRDLKPANVLLDHAGEPKIADFGLAKLSEEETQLTATEAVLGTPSYMAPEQARGDSKHAGPAVDVYALGAILYATLTGRPPFAAPSPFETAKLVMESTPEPPRSSLGPIPRDLTIIALKCLEKDPKQRYASAQAVAAELLRFLEGKPILARSISSTEHLWRTFRRHPVVASLALASFILLATIAAVATAAYFREADLKRIADARRESAVFHESQAKKNAALAAQEELSAKLEAERALRAEAAAQESARSARKREYFGLVALAHAECKAGNMSRADELLDSCPVEFRNREWHYLKRLSQTYAPLFDENEPQILESVAWSPDGKTIATGDRVGTIALWNVAIGKIYARSQELGGAAFLVKFLPNSEVVVAAGNSPFIVFHDRTTGELLDRWDFPDRVLGLDLSADGKLLAVAVRGGPVTVWNIADHEQLAELPSACAEGLRESGLAFSHDGRLLAFETVKEVLEVWDWKDAKVTRAIPAQRGDARHLTKSLLFSAGDSELIANDYYGRFRRFDLSDGKLKLNRRIHGGGYGVAVHPLVPGLLASTYDRILRVIHFEDGADPFQWSIGDHNYWSCSWSPDARWIAVTRDKSIRLIPYYERTFNTPQAIVPLGWNFDRSSSFSFTRNGLLSRDFERLLALEFMPVERGAEYTYVRDVGDFAVVFQNKRFTAVFPGGRENVSIDSSPGVRRHFMVPPDRVALLSESQIEIREVKEQALIQTYRNDSKLPLPAEWSSTRAGTMERMYFFENRTIEEKPFVHLVSFDLKSGRVEWRVPAFPSTAIPRALEVSPNETSICVANAYHTMLISASDGKILWKTVASDARPYAAFWLPDGSRIALADGAGRITLLDAETGSRCFDVQIEEQTELLTFSQDGHELRARNYTERSTVRWKGTRRRVSTTGPINLLSQTRPTVDDPRTDRLSFEKGRIRLHGFGRTIAPLAFRPVGDFRLQGSFARIDDPAKLQRTAGVVVPFGDRQAFIAFDLQNRNACGLDYLDGKGVGNEENPTSNKSMLQSGKRHEFEIHVENIAPESVRIAARLDGVELFDWTGEKERLGLHHYWDCGVPGAIALLAQDSPVEFDRLSLEMKSGHVEYEYGFEPMPDPAGWERIAPGETVDLLRHFELPACVQNAVAELTDNGLRWNCRDGGRVFLPCIPVGEYRLKLAVTRLSESGTLSIALPLGDRRVTLDIDSAWLQGGTALNAINGKSWRNSPAFSPEGKFETGRKREIEIVVRYSGEEAEILVLFDGLEILRWKGLKADLSKLNEYDNTIRYPNSLWLSAMRDPVGEFLIHSAEATILSEEGLIRKTKRIPGN